MSLPNSLIMVYFYTAVYLTWNNRFLSPFLRLLVCCFVFCFFLICPCVSTQMHLDLDLIQLLLHLSSRARAVLEGRCFDKDSTVEACGAQCSAPSQSITADSRLASFHTLICFQEVWFGAGGVGGYGTIPHSTQYETNPWTSSAARMGLFNPRSFKRGFF